MCACAETQTGIVLAPCAYLPFHLEKKRELGHAGVLVRSASEYKALEVGS